VAEWIFDGLGCDSCQFACCFQCRQSSHRRWHSDRYGRKKNTRFLGSHTVSVRALCFGSSRLSFVSFCLSRVRSRKPSNLGEKFHCHYRCSLLYFAFVFNPGIFTTWGIEIFITIAIWCDVILNIYKMCQKADGYSAQAIPYWTRNGKNNEKKENKKIKHTHTHTHNHFTALLEYVRDHPGEHVPERQNQEG